MVLCRMSLLVEEMKMKCFVCGKPHGYAGLLCKTHLALPQVEKDKIVDEYNRIFAKDVMILKKKDYSLGLLVPKRNKEGNFDTMHDAMLIMNGEEMNVIPPLVIKMDEKKIVDMRFLF